MAKEQQSQGSCNTTSGKFAMNKRPADYAMVSQMKRGKRVLGLDLASNCGASFCDIPGDAEPGDEYLIVGGQWNLSISNHDTQSIRYLRLKAYLEVARPDFICYEEVKYTGKTAPPGMKKMSVQAIVARAVTGAQVVQGLSAILVAWCEEHNIPCMAVPIGTLKNYATGSGKANKIDMIRACNTAFGTEFDTADYDKTGVDNIADSMFLCRYGVAQFFEVKG